MSDVQASHKGSCELHFVLRLFSNLHLSNVVGKKPIVDGVAAAPRPDSGDDRLGYDFVVRLKSTSYYYEVKASTGDSGAFEMGPTAIDAAQRYKADKDSKFMILYVANAIDPKKMTICVLPNPFSREGMQKLRAVGRGSVTYEFGVIGKI